MNIIPEYQLSFDTLSLLTKEEQVQFTKQYNEKLNYYLDNGLTFEFICAEFKKFSDQLQSVYDYSDFTIFDKLLKDKLPQKLIQIDTPVSAFIEQSEDYDKPPLTSEEIRSKVLIEKLNFNKLSLKYGNRVVVCSPTGSGKSLSICEAIAEDKNLELKGIILTHSNKSAELMYNQITYLGYPPDKICVFNSDRDDYQMFKTNPKKFKEFNWIICHSNRLYDGDIDVLLGKFSVEDTSTGAVHIISDECVSKSFTIHIDDALIRSFSSLSEDFQRYFFNCDKLNPKELKMTRDCVLNILGMISRKLKTDCFDDPDYIDNDLEILGISTRKLQTIIKTCISDGTNKVRIATKYEYAKNIYLLRKLINYIYNNVDKYMEFMTSSDSTLDISLGVLDLDDNIKLIIFDATAEINYGPNNGTFVVYKPLNIDLSRLVRFHNLDVDLPVRYSKDFYEKAKEGLNKIDFKSDSIILWFMNGFSESAKSEKYKLRDIVTEIINKKHLKNCHFIHYGSVDSRGSNKFSSCKNVYILGEFQVNVKAVNEHINATDNKLYSVESNSIAACEQLIGRSNFREELRKLVNGSNPELTNIYFGNLSDSHKYNLVKFYGDPSKIFEFNKVSDYYFIISNLTESSGKLIRSQSADKLKNMLDYIYKNKEVTRAELCKSAGLPNKIQKLQPYLNYLAQLGFNNLI